MNRLDIAPEHLAVVQAVLQKNVPLHTVWAFGYRVKGTAKPYSDLDLAVVGNTPLSWSDWQMIFPIPIYRGKWILLIGRILRKRFGRLFLPGKSRFRGRLKAINEKN